MAEIANLGSFLWLTHAQVEPLPAQCRSFFRRFLMQSWSRIAFMVATSLVAGCVEESGENFDGDDADAEEVGEASDEIRGGQAAFAVAPEVVSLRMNEV